MDYFNPRPREEGDVTQFTSVYTRQLISIHALVKRATPSALLAGYQSNDFNPRPREEGDVLAKNAQSIKEISIHALVKRATVDTCIIA